MMKKNLLAAIAVFFFTFVVLLIISDTKNTKDSLLETNAYAIED